MHQEVACLLSPVLATLARSSSGSGGESRCLHHPVIIGIIIIGITIVIAIITFIIDIIVIIVLIINLIIELGLSHGAH